MTEFAVLVRAGGLKGAKRAVSQGVGHQNDTCNSNIYDLLLVSFQISSSKIDRRRGMKAALIKRGSRSLMKQSARLLSSWATDLSMVNATMVGDAKNPGRSLQDQRQGE